MLILNGFDMFHTYQCDARDERISLYASEIG